MDKVFLKYKLFVLVAVMVVQSDLAAAQAFLTRGEATEIVVKHFKLEEKNKEFLRKCDQNPGECLFTFSARTNFDDFRIDPVILYPDVYPAYRFYNSINIASKLDIVSGYFAEETSPFRPEQPIKKVEALKLIFGASEMLEWKERFELEGNWLTFGENKWWYGRYVAAAVEKGLWLSTESILVDDNIYKEEFLKMLEKTTTIIANNNEKSSQLDNGRQTDKKAQSSGNTNFQADSRNSQDI